MIKYNIVRGVVILINIGICDDEEIQRNYLIKLLEKFEDITIKTFSSAEEFLFHFDDNKNFDILLLDIEMKKINGIELAKTIRKENCDAQIIFITGFPDFVMEGYDVGALHYLLKPLKEDKFYEVLEKAIANLHKIDEFILVQTDTESERINLNNIIYIEAMLHNSIITCTDKKIPAKDSISKIDNDLNENFIKCHRSYTVNLRYIKSITKTDVIMDNGDIIPLSRRLYNEINKKFIEYYRR